MQSRFLPFTLRLYSHTLHSLLDHNFTGLDLFYRIKDCWKGRESPRDLLFKPLAIGLSQKIGEWCFDAMCGVCGDTSVPAHYESIQGEALLWELEDFIAAARLSNHFSSSGILNSLHAAAEKISDSYEKDEGEYFKLLELKGEGRVELLELFAKLCGNEAKSLKAMRGLYAPEIADRILHDRQLCYFISKRILEIGFDGEQANGLRSAWVKRHAWPARVREILLSRDRGKCAQCHADLVQEMIKKLNIDHMFPLADGGCNDLVNLQLLCSSCNQAKHSKHAEAASSVPEYIERAK